MIKTVKEKPKKYGVFNIITTEIEEDPKALITFYQTLYDRMKEHLEKNNLILVGEVIRFDDPFHEILECTKEGCEFKKEGCSIENCLEHHPEYVKTKGIVHLVGLIWRAIPRDVKYED